MLLSLDGYRKPDLRDRRPSGLWDAYIRTDVVEALWPCREPEGSSDFSVQAP